MKPSRIKPISYVKTNARKLIYEQTQETLALLKILALGNRQIDEGQVLSAAEAVRRVRGKKST